MENRAHALAAGLFIIALLVASALTGSFIAGQQPPREYYRVVSAYPIGGVSPQGDVRFQGLSVGRVRDVGYDSKNTRCMTIDIEVNKDLVLSPNAYAQLELQGLTGSSYVHILERTDKADKAAKPEAPAKAGKPDQTSRTECEKTAAAANERLIYMARGKFDAIIDTVERVGDEAEKLMQQAKGALSAKNLENFEQTLESFRKASKGFEGTPAQLQESLNNVNSLLSKGNRDAVAATLVDARAVAKDVRRQLDTAPDLARNVDAMAKDVSRVSIGAASLATELQGTVAEVRTETLPRAHALAESVERGAERVGRLAYELEKRPESVIWGRPPVRPGPGEEGFQ